MKFASLFAALAIFAFILGGCKDDSTPAGPGGGGGTATSYVGVMAGTGVSGSITISIPTAKRAVAPTATAADTTVITGVLKINGGATVNLTGFYVATTGEIYLTGGGYTFVGVLDSTEGTIAGSFSWSGGSGFFSCDEGNAANVKTFCGQYQDNSPGTESGSFNMTLNGNEILVIVYPDDEGGQGFMTYGTLSAGNEIAIYDPESGFVVATGTYNASTNSVAGVYAGDPGGTWSGTLCN